MRLFKRLNILCFLFIIPWIRAKILKHKNSLRIHQKMNSVLIESHIFEKLNPIIVSNDLEDIIAGSLWTDEIIPTILIDPNFEISNDSGMFLPKLPTYILSTNKLQIVVQIIKFTSWWNINSHFFIVSENCDDAWSSLQTMWKMNLLSSVFVCNDVDDSFALYTFNPYANFAPKTWKHMKTVVHSPSQQWTLFKRFESTGYYDCDDLFFDKTKFLNGSEVVVAGTTRFNTPAEVGKPYNSSSIKHKLPFLMANLFQEICLALNVTPVIYYIDLRNSRKVQNESIDGLLQSLTDNTRDVALTSFSDIDISDGFDILYLRLTGSYLIVKRHTKIASSLKQLGSVFNMATVAFTGFVFVVTFIVLLLCKRPQFGSACLEILSLLLSKSMLFQFHRHSLRIFIASVLILVICMNSIYQAKMSAYSTKINRDEVNSITDLQNLKYSIYMNRIVGKFYDVESWTNEQKKYLHLVKNNECKDIIDKNDFSSACVVHPRIYIPIAEKHNLHAFLDKHTNLVVIFVRRDWPLKAQTDRVLSHLSEAGFIFLWDNIEVHEPLKKIKHKGIEIFDEYREVVLSDLYPTLKIFAIFLAMSFVVFLIEISIPKFRLSTKITLIKINVNDGRKTSKV